jgi:hypothetical protein
VTKFSVNEYRPVLENLLIASSALSARETDTLTTYLQCRAVRGEQIPLALSKLQGSDNTPWKHPGRSAAISSQEAQGSEIRYTNKEARQKVRFRRYIPQLSAFYAFERGRQAV